MLRRFRGFGSGARNSDRRNLRGQERGKSKPGMNQTLRRRMRKIEGNYGLREMYAFDTCGAVWSALRRFLQSILDPRMDERGDLWWETQVAKHTRFVRLRELT
jgi:hypothetical protein